MSNNTYKKIGNTYGAWIDCGYGRTAKAKPVAGEVVEIQTKAGETHKRTVKAIVQDYKSGCVVSLEHDEAICAKAKARYAAKAAEGKKDQVAPLSPASTLSRAQKARIYDDVYNEGGEGYNPYR